jgi:acetyltransferase-like isoleucine patch superfamily enzyme
MNCVSLNFLYHFGFYFPFFCKKIAIKRGVRFESTEVEIGRKCDLGGQLIIEKGVSIREFTRIFSKGRLRIKTGVEICGKNVIEPSHPQFFSRSVIKEDTYIGYANQIDLSGGLTIGKNCLLTSEIRIFTHKHTIPSRRRLVRFGEVRKSPVVIGDDVFIGYRAIIHGDVTIGNGAVVGDGAVVTKDVGEYDIVGGIPARKIGERK